MSMKIPKQLIMDKLNSLGVMVYNWDLTEIRSWDIGFRTRIGSMTIIHDDVRIGKDCLIGSHCNICPGVRIKNNVSIQIGCHITRGVRIGSDSFIGPGVVTTNDKYMDHMKKPVLLAPWIGCRVRIGANTVILPGVRINSDVVIGAGSVVTKNIPRGQTWLGNPARRVR